MQGFARNGSAPTCVRRASVQLPRRAQSGYGSTKHARENQHTKHGDVDVTENQSAGDKAGQSQANRCQYATAKPAKQTLASHAGCQNCTCHCGSDAGNQTGGGPRQSGRNRKGSKDGRTSGKQKKGCCCTEERGTDTGFDNGVFLIGCTANSVTRCCSFPLEKLHKTRPLAW